MTETDTARQPQAFIHFRHALWARRRVFFEAVVGTVVLSLIGLATSLYSMQVYDRVIPNQGFDTLWVLSVGVLLAIVLELVMKQARAAMVDRACKAIDEELSDIFFTRALAIRMDRRPRTVGTFAAQVRMFESVRAFLTSTTLFVLADLPFALLFVAVIAWIAGPLAWIPLALLPLSLLTGLMFVRPVARLALANAAEATQKNGLLIESIDGAETVKALAAEEGIRPAAAGQAVIALVALEDVVPVKADQGVGAVPAIEGVGGGAAGDGVRAEAADEEARGVGHDDLPGGGAKPACSLASSVPP